MQHDDVMNERLAIPEGLTPELVRTLCLLDDVPPGVAEATIALLPYGSRVSLAAHGIIGGMPEQKDAAARIQISDYGRAVIAACARRACGDTDEHPTISSSASPSSRRHAKFAATWRPRAESLDHELTRAKQRIYGRLDEVRGHHRAAH